MASSGNYFVEIKSGNTIEQKNYIDKIKRTAMKKAITAYLFQSFFHQ